MSYYHTCQHCGANLDPGERCDCGGSAWDNTPLCGGDNAEKGGQRVDNRLDRQVRELRVLQSIEKEISEKMDILTDSIQSQMTQQRVAELVGEDWKCSLVEKTQYRFNMSALRKAVPDVGRYATPHTTRRLVVS